ncbi:MAG: hypothetical protein LBR92_02645 [Puniceicoccales bacterium]|jgi:hypothetical protein|nr:hypothetical protein [Puniceicoccales bacterium]
MDDESDVISINLYGIGDDKEPSDENEQTENTAENGNQPAEGPFDDDINNQSGYKIDDESANQTTK